MLRRARDAIGVTDPEMVVMHEEAYAAAVQDGLDGEGKVGGDDLERVRSVLCVGEREARRIEEEVRRKGGERGGEGEGSKTC